MRKIILFISMLFISAGILAQTKTFYGKVLDSITLLPISNIQVENINTHAKDITNNKGLFLLKASLNDKLSFLRVGYYNFTYKIDEKAAIPDTLLLYMNPKIEQLQTVIVSSYSYADYQTDSIDRRNFFESAIGYPQKIFGTANSGAGLGISLERLFGKREKNKKRAYKLLLQHEKDEYINFRYNPILIYSYTKLRGDSLADFMHRYTPTYEWLRNHPKMEDVMYYVNDKMKIYFKH